MGDVIFIDHYQKWGSREPHHTLAEAWFSCEGYYQHRIYNIPRDHLSKLRRWMHRNLEGEVIIKQMNTTAGPVVIFGFEIEEDFIAFKLVWGSEDD